MESINIIQLIEKNSMTRLSKNYENKLVNKIKTAFTNNEQQIFLASFYCFLNYDSNKDFVVDFDKVWKWLGFTRKGHAKTLLEKHFTINTDYIIKKPASAIAEAGFKTVSDLEKPTGADYKGVNDVENIFRQTVENKNSKLDPSIDGSSFEGVNDIKKAAPPISRVAFEDTKSPSRNFGGAGQNKEIIMLTVNAFKKFCLKAGTSKADEVHDYYIKLENLLQETINEETNELRLQLSNKEQEKNKIEEENKKLEEEKIKIEKEKNKLEEENIKLTRKYVKKEKEIFDNKNVVYLMTTDEAEKNGEYVVGKAFDLTRRKEDYNHNKLHDFKVVYHVCCKGPKIMDCLESLILSKLGKYRCKAGRDAFCIPENNDISLFTNMFDTCFKMYDDVNDDDVRYPVATKQHLKQDRKEYQKKYYENNIERLKENQKLFYENNKDVISLISKIYCQENQDKIREKLKKYYEKHKDEILKVNMEYYYENRDSILEKRKEFYQNNKEHILAEREKYYNENYKTKIAPQRQELLLCECGMSISNYCMNKHKKTKTHMERMENINKPITSKLKERVECECGMVLACSSLKRHIGTERHTTLMERKKESL